jgi:hypothetical protein
VYNYVHALRLYSERLYAPIVLWAGCRVRDKIAVAKITAYYRLFKAKRAVRQALKIKAEKLITAAMEKWKAWKNRIVSRREHRKRAERTYSVAEPCEIWDRDEEAWLSAVVENAVVMKDNCYRVKITDFTQDRQHWTGSTGVEVYAGDMRPRVQAARNRRRTERGEEADKRRKR